MLILSFFSWWYGAGWLRVASEVRRRMRYTVQLFSIPTILRTMFAPWKQDKVSGKGSLNMLFQAMISNMIARLIGFMIRLFFLFFALLTLAVIAVVGLVVFVVWPLLPVSIIFLVWKAMS
jgi:hypothetical protein